MLGVLGKTILLWVPKMYRYCFAFEPEKNIIVNESENELCGCIVMESDSLDHLALNF